MANDDSDFIASLEKLRDAKDKAALARLRRGLGKEMGAPEMYRYVYQYLHECRQYRRCFLVASLFGLHWDKAKRGVSFGAVFREIWKKFKESESIEKRFTNLLSADPDDLGEHLRHAVSLAKSKGVPIDYYRLFFHIKRWDHPNRFVQREWAKDFWGSEKQQVEETITKGE